MLKTLLVIAVCVAFIICGTDAFAYSKDSSLFQYIYDADTLPSDVSVSPRWERMTTGDAESSFCSVSGGILTLDTAQYAAGDYAYYVMPGTNSSEIAGGGEFYTSGDPSNPWQVDVDKGYTVEIKFQMDSVVDVGTGEFAFSINAREGTTGWMMNWQIWTNKITSNFGGEVLHYSGDLTGSQHILRLVRAANTYPKDPANREKVYRLYLNGTLLNPGGQSGSLVDTGGTWNDLSIGDVANDMWNGAIAAAANTDISIDVDYVRFDMTGAYTPPGVGSGPVCGDDGYLIGDLDDDCQSDLTDFAIIALNWMANTDPALGGTIDCTDPANAAICQD